MADPLEIKLIIKATLVSNPLKTTVQQLQRDFKSSEGYNVPFRELGFQSFVQYLHSIPDCVQVFGSGPEAEVRVVLDQKSAHVAALVSKQRTNTKKRRPPSRYHRFVYERPVERARSIVRYVAQGPQRSHGSERNPRSFSSGPHRTSYGFEGSHRHVPRATMGASYGFEKSPVQSDSSLDSTDFDADVKSESTSTGAVSKIQLDLKTINTPKKDDTHLICEPPPCEPPPPPHINGIKPKIIKSVGETKVDNPVCTKINANARQSRVDGFNFNNVENINYKVPFAVQEDINNLIKQFPGGLWCSHLPTEYKKLYGRNLNYVDYLYKSLIQLCCELPYILKFVRPSKGDYKLFHIDHVFTDGDLIVQEETCISPADSEKTLEKPAIPINIAAIIKSTMPLAPASIVPLDVYIPHQDIESIEGEYIDIQIAEVYDPSKFWFNLHKHVNKLDELMDNMQIFYRENWKRYEIPSCLLQHELYCVVIYMKEFHRAIVSNMMPHNKLSVKVFFIDYGTVSTVRMEGICYLHKNFGELPAQAIRGRLAKIQPHKLGEQWSLECAQRFLELIRNKILVAQIDSIDQPLETFDLIIADTNGDDDIFINDSLVNDGFALFAHEEPDGIFSYGNYTPVVENLHLYPTFKEIENGLVPSASEMSIMFNSKIPIYKIYDHYFKMNEENIEKPHFSDVLLKLDTPIQQEQQSQSPTSNSTSSVCNGFLPVFNNKHNIQDTLNNRCVQSPVSTVSSMSVEELEHSITSRNTDSPQLCNRSYSRVKTIMMDIKANIDANPDAYKSQIPDIIQSNVNINDQSTLQNIPYQAETRLSPPCPSQQFTSHQKHTYMSPAPHQPQGKYINITSSPIPIQASYQKPICPPPGYHVPVTPLHYQIRANPQMSYPCQMPTIFYPFDGAYKTAPTYQIAGCNPASYNMTNSYQNTIVNNNQHPNKSTTEPNGNFSFLKFHHELNKTTPATKMVIRAKMFGLCLHIILYKAEPHVILNEVHKYYPSFPILKLKRILCMERSIAIVDVNLKYNPDLHSQLTRYGAIDGTTVIDLVPLRYLPDIIKQLGSESILTEPLEAVLRQYSRDSDEWKSDKNCY